MHARSLGERAAVTFLVGQRTARQRRRTARRVLVSLAIVTTALVGVLLLVAAG